MQITLETVVSVASVTFALIAIWISRDSYILASRTATREATEIIFNEWWTDEMRELRRYFFQEFVPKHRAKLNGKGLKDIEQVVLEDQGKVLQLCYFFDKVGWQCAVGLVDPDYVLGPMQQLARLIWTVLEPLILEERKYRQDRMFNPVYLLGFEWLFQRSSLRKKHQAYLLQARLVRPRLMRSRKDVLNLKEEIEHSEATFCAGLKQHLEHFMS